MYISLSLGAPSKLVASSKSETSAKWQNSHHTCDKRPNSSTALAGPSEVSVGFYGPDEDV